MIEAVNFFLVNILPSFILVERFVRRFEELRFVRRFEERRFPPLRLRVAAAFFAARLRFALLALRVFAALRAAAERFADVERDLPDLRFAVLAFFPPLRLRVAAPFFAARLRFAAFALRVFAALRAAAERFAEVERDFVDLRLVEEERFFPALRRRVRHAFFAAALRAAFVPRRAVGLRVDRLVVFFLVVVRVFRAILVFLLDFEELRLDFPFGGLTRTRVPSAIEYGCKMS